MITDTSPESTRDEESNGSANETKAEAPSPEQEREREMESLQSKAQEAERKYLYLYSEFENFRKRTERDRLDFLKFGHEGFLRETLQVLDNFERALTHAKSMGGEKGSPLAQVTQGIEMIHYQLLETLKNQGVNVVQSVGAKFDPNLHEAVGDEQDEAEAGTILREELKGFTLHGRLLRPSRVIVSKK